MIGDFLDLIVIENVNGGDMHIYLDHIVLKDSGNRCAMRYFLDFIGRALKSDLKKIIFVLN